MTGPGIWIQAKARRQSHYNCIYFESDLAMIRMPNLVYIQRSKSELLLLIWEGPHYCLLNCEIVVFGNASLTVLATNRSQNVDTTMSTGTLEYSHREQPARPTEGPATTSKSEKRNTENAIQFSDMKGM